MFSMQDLLIIIGIAVAKFAYGWLWYGMVFKTQWLKLMRESGKPEPKESLAPMLINFLGVLASSFVFFYLVDRLDITSVIDGAFLGFLLWLGFVIATNVDALVFEGQNRKLFTLNNAYHMTSFILMGILYGFFY